MPISPSLRAELIACAAVADQKLLQQGCDGSTWIYTPGGGYLTCLGCPKCQYAPKK